MRSGLRAALEPPGIHSSSTSATASGRKRNCTPPYTRSTQGHVYPARKARALYRRTLAVRSQDTRSAVPVFSEQSYRTTRSSSTALLRHQRVLRRPLHPKGCSIIAPTTFFSEIEAPGEHSCVSSRLRDPSSELQKPVGAIYFLPASLYLFS